MKIGTVNAMATVNVQNNIQGWTTSNKMGAPTVETWFRIRENNAIFCLKGY
jgi:hypothetical protein